MSVFIVKVNDCIDSNNLNKINITAEDFKYLIENMQVGGIKIFSDVEVVPAQPANELLEVINKKQGERDGLQTNANKTV